MTSWGSHMKQTHHVRAKNHRSQFPLPARRQYVRLHYLFPRFRTEKVTISHQNNVSLTATSTLCSSRDKDPWGQVSSVPTPVSVHYKLPKTLVINLITNFEHLPLIVTSIWVELLRPSWFELAVPNDPWRSSPPDAKLEVTVRVEKFSANVGMWGVKSQWWRCSVARFHVSLRLVSPSETRLCTRASPGPRMCVLSGFPSLFDDTKKGQSQSVDQRTEREGERKREAYSM